MKNNYTEGRFNINWGEGYTRGSIVGAQGPYGHYTWQDGIRLDSAVTSRNHGVYAQDAWQVHPRLTVNAGIRIENEFLPPFRAEVDGIKIANPISFGWDDKIAPRVGAAWDILGNGRWKLSSSWVRVNDVLGTACARVLRWRLLARPCVTLDSPDLAQLSKSNPGALGRKLIEIDNRTVPINSAGQLEGIDPDIKPMSHNNFDVTTEYLLAPLSTFTLRYTHKRLRYAIEDIGVLDEFESEVYPPATPGSV